MVNQLTTYVSRTILKRYHIDIYLFIKCSFQLFIAIEWSVISQKYDVFLRNENQELSLAVHRHCLREFGALWTSIPYSKKRNRLINDKVEKLSFIFLASIRGKFAT